MEKFVKEIYDLRPWYHDFKLLGIKTNFPPQKKYLFWGPKIRQTRTQMDQQQRKESVISKYIEAVLEDIQNKPDFSILDLFCADGYYGFYTQSHSPGSKLVGVDISEDDIKRCNTISSYLNLGQASFINDDVSHFVENCDSFDLVLCIGGLYHISDPKTLIQSLRKITKQYLIVQSAITIEHDDPYYYETPNPWFGTWGTLFTNSQLLGWLKEAGFKIIESTINKREDPNPQFIGASYVLLK